MNIDKLTGA